jgi:hypothetical protein
MNITKIIGIVLIVLGAAALAVGGFSYTKESHEAKIGPLSLAVKEKETVNVPTWAGIGAIVLGVVFLVVPGGRK